MRQGISNAGRIWMVEDGVYDEKQLGEIDQVIAWVVFSYTPRAAGLAWPGAVEPARRVWPPRFGAWGGVKYENYQGHDLDREMLELLRQG
jgi:hypothetical protein